MARKIVVLCDIHLGEHDEEVEATREETIGLTGMKPRIVAVCQECDDEFIQPLRAMVMEFGQIADSPPEAPKSERSAPEFQCPSCGRGYKYKKSLKSHAEDVHGVTLSELVEGSSPEEQLQLGIDPEAKKPEVTRAECGIGDCDVVYEWPQDRRPSTSVAVHRRRKHGVKGKKAAAAEAGAA